MHQQTRACIDLDDRAALLTQRAGNIFGNQINPGDVQTHDARGQLHRCRHFRVYPLGHIEGDIAGALNQYRCTRRRNGIGAITLP